MTAMLNLVDPDLEWTYLDPSAATPRPQVCHGRGELQAHSPSRPNAACAPSWRR